MKKTLTIISCLISSFCIAQTFTIDLSQNLNSTFSQTIEPQLLTTIVLKNRVLVSTVKYTIDVKKQHPVEGPIQTSGFLGTLGGNCDAVEKAMDALAKETSESKILEQITKLKTEIEKPATIANCATDVANAKQLIDLASSVTIPLIPINIKSGDKITITITKDDKNKWTYIFETEKINHSKIYYGFSYLFSNGLTSYPNYYAKADTGSTYLVTRSNSTNKGVLKNISPTFMYSYLFFKNPDAPVKFGLTGGFMIDLSNPSVMFSPSLIIGENVSLNLGVAFTRKDQLKGQYYSGERIKDNLDFEQLHNKVWTYDLFFSIGFHFDKNPFKKEEKDDSKSK